MNKFIHYIILILNYLKYIFPNPKANVEESLRLFLTYGCPQMAQEQRHNRLAGIRYDRKLSREKRTYYKYNLESFHDIENFRLYWDSSVLTNRTIMVNRLDIIVVEKEKRITFLIDNAVTNTNYLQVTIHTVQYTYFTNEIRQQW